jgi:hypothetical protein
MRRMLKPTYEFTWKDEVYNEELDDFVTVTKTSIVEYNTYVECGTTYIDEIDWIDGDNFPTDLWDTIAEEILDEMHSDCW